MTNNTVVYNAQDVFENISDDPENVTMKIPSEIAEQADIVPGDNLKISWGDQGTVIIEKIKENTDTDE